MHALQRINHKEASPFLEGVFAPVDTETFSNDLKVVSGAIPAELSGYYLRTGANPRHRPWGGYHWYVNLTLCSVLTIAVQLHIDCQITVGANAERRSNSACFISTILLMALWWLLLLT